MREIRVSKPTGFRAKNSVHILDKHGRTFYQFQKDGNIDFNLPVGTYLTMSELTPLPAPIRYDFKAKRKREVFHYSIPKPSEIKVEFAPNPNKASILLPKRHIIFDTSWNRFPGFVKKYLFYHELGHYLYKTEEFCDEFAQEQMLKEGYNKSQIEFASRATLHDGHSRQRACVHNLKNARKK